VNAAERERFEKANQKVHKVETQWHHPILTKYGFVPETKVAVGFVRVYVYEHPETGRRVCCNTGVNADYWSEEGRGGGYWSELEPHLKLMAGEAGQ
jgi:hypothetical protein